ncbi:hypothetical protein M427DRAFT_42276 [Gonapodya prolifera JEL478]|uniref:Uncharacterized protein n=1 Tax=Gonapodya prolifera (strain JEL478) TaxID=1344416 RepID=A0A139AP73_GONPJ|nr:hypothetical protein M427DRAFT_42276 [Gonapodya prolifera JEL478]|eukprot:KXS18549.1 hypothetical protein M427DRAFT_42276 [Gonapodya prolifera JEL478]
MSTGNPFSDAPFPVDPTDVPIQLQVYVNSITLASFSAQTVILATFLNDLAVLPVALRMLSLTSLVASMMSALTVFLSNNLTCKSGNLVGSNLRFEWWRESTSGSTAADLRRPSSVPNLTVKSWMLSLVDRHLW